MTWDWCFSAPARVPSARRVSPAAMPGLQSAFLRAGARGVIATLWPIEDVLAREFTADFYQRFTHGESAVQALSETQRAWLAPGGASIRSGSRRRRITALAHAYFSIWSMPRTRSEQYERRRRQKRYQLLASPTHATGGPRSSRGSRGRSPGSSSPTSTRTTSAPPRTPPSSTGAPVAQGRLDYEQCELVWGGDDWACRARRLVPTGTASPTRYLRARRAGVAVPPVHPLPARPRAARARRPGGRLEGRRRARACGRPADAPSRRDPRRRRSSPRPHLADVGLWPQSRADPLGDYLDALEETIALEPSFAGPGHGEPIADPSGRARQLLAHHRERLEATAAALSAEPGRATRSRSRSSAAT